MFFLEKKVHFYVRNGRNDFNVLPLTGPEPGFKKQILFMRIIGFFCRHAMTRGILKCFFSRAEIKWLNSRELSKKREKIGKKKLYKNVI